METHVVFDDDAIPSRIWKFDGLTYLQAEDPKKRRQHKRENPTLKRAHKFEWSNALAGNCDGLTWEWPE